MARFYLFFLIMFAVYGGLYWLTTGSQGKHVKQLFLLSSAAAFAILVALTFVDLWLALSGAVCALLLAVYLGNRQYTDNAGAIRNGVYGGLWLSIPFYVYLIANT